MRSLQVLKSKKNRLWIILCASLLGVFSAYQIATFIKISQTGTSFLNIYSHPVVSHKLSLEVPFYWVVFIYSNTTRDPELKAYISFPLWVSNSITIRQKEFSVKDLNSVVEWADEKNRKLSNYSPQLIAPYTNGRMSGERRDYFFTTLQINQSIEMKCEEFFFMEDSEGYIVSFCLEKNIWTKWQITIDRMENSMEWFNNE
jgi:hypothetical protein